MDSKDYIKMVDTLKDRLVAADAMRDVLMTLKFHHEGQAKPTGTPVSKEWHAHLSKQINKALGFQPTTESKRR